MTAAIPFSRAMSLLLAVYLGAAWASAQGVPRDTSRRTDEIAPLSETQEVSIYRVLHDGRLLALSDDGTARPPLGERNLEIRYRVTGSSESVHFQFFMEGLEAEWADVGKRTIAYYRDVEPGSYTFHVRAQDTNGRWESMASLPVVIAPFIYETGWFRALLLAAFLALVVIAYVWQTRRVTARSAELERLVEERTRALQAEKGVVEEQAIQLLHMDHMKSRLFANLSHEFRTPLTLILDPLDRAANGSLGPLDADTARALEQARQNALRLIRLTNQILDLAKLEAGSMELRAREEDLVAFLRQTVDIFSSEAERRGVSLLFRSDLARLPVYYEREKLEKIVFNLISNALKATPQGGKVLVSAQLSNTGEKPEMVEIVVRDTGTGISEDQLPHVFDRFYQAETGYTGGGTGIGLALVKELTDLHAGEVDVESQLGFGSTFTVRLPLGRVHLADHNIVDPPDAVLPSSVETVLAQASETPPAEASPEALSTQLSAPLTREADRRPCVLVVEDHAEIRAMICEHLRDRYRLIEAGDGEEGLRLAREHRPALVLSDVLMPGVDGLELCRRIKADARLAGTPVLLLTARAGDESRLEGLGTGADDYLTKPFSGNELLARVANLIRTRSAMRDHFSQEVVLKPFDTSVPSADAAFMERVLVAIEARVADSEFTVGDLADAVGLSQTQLKRKLRTIVDQSPVEFIRSYRLERAAELLRRRTGNVSEIAYMVGFENVSYFAKCFRDRYGLSPSRFAAGETVAEEPG